MVFTKDGGATGEAGMSDVQKELKEAGCNCRLSTKPIPETIDDRREAQRRFYLDHNNHNADCPYRRNYFDKK
jgi:hypothetical protein